LFPLLHKKGNLKAKAKVNDKNILRELGISIMSSVFDAVA
jgi:hypothetical protein